MGSTRVKICGITREEDVDAAVDSGADAIGLVFYADSPRAVAIDQAKRLAHRVPPFVTLVGLFVDAEADEINNVLQNVPLDLLQFHGEESPDFCAQFSRPWIKALRMRPELSLTESCRMYAEARGILLDTFKEGVAGGTGEVFDWSLAGQALPLPVVLAGGLNSGNVAQAIQSVAPAAVDVSGGVESSPGIKSADKIREFIAAVKAVETGSSR